MSTFHLILREILHRKLNFLLSISAIVIAVAFFVSFFTTGDASKRETTRLMRDIGFNLRIIPKETNMDKFWTTGFSEEMMPESYAADLASQEGLIYAHITASLQKKILWRGFEVILTGIAQEASSPQQRESTMTVVIKPGTVHLGFELAHGLELKKGDTVDILGTSFTIAQCLSESGSDDDIRIYAYLKDVQNLLNLNDKINEIKALQCLCFVGGKNINSFPVLQERLAQVLPETKVILIQSIAAAREKQRLMTEEYFAFFMPFVVVVCMAWIGVLALMNVRERKQEIGIMRALGYGSGKIALLFLGKAVTLGLIGALLGYGIGTVIAQKFGPDIFKITAKMIKPSYVLLYWSIIIAPVFCALATFIPSMIAVTQDPAVTLREE